MKQNIRLATTAGLIFCATALASYGLAKAGEPQSAWMWKIILGLFGSA